MSLISKLFKYISQNPIISYGWLLLGLGIICISSRNIDALVIGIFGIVMGVILIVSGYSKKEDDYKQHLKYIEDEAQSQISILNEYNLSIEKNPNNPDNYFYRGVFNYRNKDYNSAIKDFQAVIKFNPKHEQAHIYIAECEEAIGDYSDNNLKL